MFRKNETHRQRSMFGSLNELLPKQQQRLAESWAGTFYAEIFTRIDETPYAVLYDDHPSRPNIPVNILVGLEILKAGFGWSDEEMYENYCYNLQVRHALGLQMLSENHFELRTLYNFRQRLTKHMQEHGENLFEQTFETISAEQLQKFKVKSNHKRVDSTQIASNIREMSRLQLLVEILQRTHRMLSDTDQARYQVDFEPYLSGTSGQFTYHLKGEGAHRAPLQAIGQLMGRLVDELAADYQTHPTYQLLCRVFNEHFEPSDDNIHPKNGRDLRAGNLQSPDDPDATFRRKRDENYIGYVADITETAHPDNDFQLITRVKAEPNTVDDAVLLAEQLQEMDTADSPDIIYADGGYGSPEVDALAAERGIELHQTALRGASPRADGFDLAACELTFDADNRTLLGVALPNGDVMRVKPGRKKGRYILRYPAETPVPDPPTGIYLSQQQVNVALRRQRCRQDKLNGKNPRAAIEATIGALKRPFGNDKVPVRGKFRVGMLIIGSAMMVNLRRIHRHQEKMRRQAAKQAEANGSDSALSALFRRVRGVFRLPAYSIYRFSNLPLA